MTTLHEKIANRTVHIAVIGLGYVGLPLATAFARAGFRVTGVDIDQSKVDAVNAGRSYILDVPDDDVSVHVRSGRFAATSDYDVLREVDVIFVCVPTPYDAQRAPDLSYIKAATHGIRSRIKSGQLIVLQSTTYPGTTEEVVQRILEESGLKAGVDFYLAFSPERIDPGNKQWSAHNTPKVVGGLTPECTRLTCELLSRIGAPVYPVSSPAAAELTKLLENTFRAVNIALVNELALLAERMGIDFWEVIEAAKTKPFGFMPFYPGPGVGGHCLSPDEYIFLRNGKGGLESVRIGDYFQVAQNDSGSRSICIQGVSLVAPTHTEVLGFDPVSGKTIFKPLRYVSARPYDGRMVQVVTADGRRLTVTDGHPMITPGREGFLVKRADRLVPGDALVVARDLPCDSATLSFDLMATTQSQEYGSFATVQVREVTSAPDVTTVYSLETDNPHTFVTSYGLVVHNCIPIDPYYLSWKAREYDYYAEFIELAGEVNQAMPYHVVDLVSQALSLHGKPMRGARVLVLGVAFKPDIDDARNSPAERIIELLLSRGASVRYHDPYVPRFKVGNNVFHREPVILDSVPLTPEESADADCVVVVTGHHCLDYAQIVSNARLVVDTCNATAQVMEHRDKIVRLGAPLPKIK